MDSAAVVNFVELSTKALDDAHGQIKTAEASRKEYLSQVNATVDTLVQEGFIRKDAAAKAAAVLSDPKQALDQLVQLAKVKLASDAQPVDALGSPISQTKTASAGRPTRQPRQADLDFVRNLGLSPEFA